MELQQYLFVSFQRDAFFEKELKRTAGSGWLMVVFGTESGQGQEKIKIRILNHKKSELTLLEGLEQKYQRLRVLMRKFLYDQLCIHCLRLLLPMNLERFSGLAGYYI